MSELIDQLVPFAVPIASVLAGAAIGGIVFALSRGVSPLVSTELTTLRRASTASAHGIPDDPVLATFDALGPLGERVLPASLCHALEESYRRAGAPGRLHPRALAGACLVTGGGLALVLVIMLSMSLGGIWSLLGLAGVFIGPALVLGHLEGMGKKRSLRIRRVLPYVLDLLVLTTRAGSSLLHAMRLVAEEYAGHPIAEELERVLVDIDVGVPKREAFEALSHRLPIDEVRSLVDTILLSEELGRPISDAIERLADRLRVARVQAAESAAGSASTYVALPTMLVFISVLLLLFAPFAVKWVTGGYDAAL